ncbi:unnamed protein product [Cyprideis torosa]|uniref:Uncharacterized protein n=1 Tax=Cyprideis torosa TaxID=163714 RepID=A0A7R8WC87_9CRUS|nr:unnamed protein product [Cyprideis torosa]CAG0887740.1 unnamed protein product [Cyprideis torosa]
MRLGIVSLVAFMAFAVWFLIDQTSASAFKRREVNGLQNIDDVYHKLGRPRFGKRAEEVYPTFLDDVPTKSRSSEELRSELMELLLDLLRKSDY